MKSKLEIVKIMHAEHTAKHTNIVEDCPFCQRKNRDACTLLEEAYEEDLLEIVDHHMKYWNENGIAIGNGIGSHKVSPEIVSQIIYSWLQIPKIEIEDFPEEYIHEEKVLETWFNQKK